MPDTFMFSLALSICTVAGALYSFKCFYVLTLLTARGIYKRIGMLGRGGQEEVI